MKSNNAGWTEARPPEAEGFPGCPPPGLTSDVSNAPFVVVRS